MAINTQKWVVGGVVTGIVMNVIDFLVNKFVFGARYVAELNAFKAGLGDTAMAGNAVWVYVVFDLIIGLALIWTYAAMRPRFGPGFKTLAYAAILFWVLFSIAYYGYMQMGMMSSGLWWQFGLVGLINLLISGAIGARLYSEDAVAP